MLFAKKHTRKGTLLGKSTVRKGTMFRKGHFQERNFTRKNTVRKGTLSETEYC
jgi:hypothetical protein